MTEQPLKPGQVADRDAAARSEEAAALARAWWRRVPRVVTAPRGVFRALAETDELDLEARSEPILAIAIVAGIAVLPLTPAWGRLLDDSAVDGLVIAVLTFLGGVFYAAAGAFLLGAALWVGARGVGVEAPMRIARQLVVLAAVPIALSIVVTLPAILLGFGGDWFRSGGSDSGAWRTAIVAVGLGAVGWSFALVALGLRETFRLPWRGVAGALSLATVIVAALVVLPSAL